MWWHRLCARVTWAHVIPLSPAVWISTTTVSAGLLLANAAATLHTCILVVQLLVASVGAVVRPTVAVLHGPRVPSVCSTLVTCCPTAPCHVARHAPLEWTTTSSVCHGQGTENAAGIGHTCKPTAGGHVIVPPGPWSGAEYPLAWRAPLCCTGYGRQQQH